MSVFFDTYIFNIISLAGGLAIFLFGMNIMGEGLERTSGGKLKKILENLTSNPFKGLLLGLGVTAVIQSSSATTVMVVGFVNSGIMKFSQSIGIIMGANVGTTVTAWLLSLSLIGDTGSLFLKFFKPSTLFSILAFLGIIMYMFIKKPKSRNVGKILLGFAVLINGMETMSSSVGFLADMPEFRNILLIFSNPLLGILMGALLTAVIQSSSAAIGILQALSVTGGITYSNAVPIILGQNIGTCITAIVSAIGTNKNAKRVAAVHLFFNILGALLFLLIFYILNAIFKFPFMNKPVSAVNIATIHSIFNIVATVCLFPFSKFLGKIAYILIPENGEDKKNELLDERLIATPSVAIAHAKSVANRMAYKAAEAIKKSISLMDGYDEAAAKQVTETEKETDMYEDKLGTYLVKLSRRSLGADDSRTASNLLHTIGDFERIADHAVNIYEAFLEMNEKKADFSKEAKKDLAIMTEAVNEILDMSIKAFVKEDIALAKHVEPLEEIIDLLKMKMKSKHILRLQSAECTIETGFIFSDLITNFERIADHCSNISVCLIQISNDSFDTHEYLGRVKNEGENDFEKHYKLYKDKYRI